MNFKQSVLVVSLLFFASCVERGATTHSTIKVKCEEVRSECGVGHTSSYPGKVMAVSDVNLSFRVAGVIDKIAAKEGQFVRRGEVVAYMDDRDYKLQVEATQAEYNSIKGEVDRIVALYGDHSVSQNDYEKAVNGLKQITVKLSAHCNAYEDTKLKAPFDGYVQTINFDRGEAVAAGTPVMKFVSASSPEIVVNIPAVEYLRRAKLLSATATLSSYPERSFALEYIGVSHKANLNQLYETRFRVLSEDGIYPTFGMSTMVSLNYDSAESSKLSIPLSAVFERAGASYVWRVVDNSTLLTPIEVGKINRDGRASVSGGLQAGDVIVTAGVNSLKEGENVEPLAKPSKSNVGNIL
ncbi:MAG: efflux RND transporter periplasmic adaptor subunit [Rikenellaceae bacterium]